MNLQTFLEKTWQNHLQFLDFTANFKDKFALDIAEIAIILSVNSNNFERYFALKEFNEIFKKLNLRVDIFEIQNAQICAINLLKMGFLDKELVLKALRILEKISFNSLIFEFIENLSVPKIDKKEQFKSNFNELNQINLELSSLSFDEKSKFRLAKMLEKFQNLEFNVAITGVMNAGKSSLLNALLKQDFLGVSNIPETANLTLLKYGKSNEAKIYFWSRAEWENIIISSKFSKDLENFINKLKENLNLDEYIKEENKTQIITLQELKHFSSAKNELSALIKKIEIYSDLKFLQNNISIVDTPGLDDVVIQREIVTNEYLKESDFLIHLMNASQSLSQKDAEFLINCLINSRLNKFLIVLTKADLLSESELKEVIDYTKNSLKSRLKNIENLDLNLIEKIDFLCVSAKKASDFYNKLSDEKSLKDSGMLEFEAYLFDALYSSEKSKIALDSYKKELHLELKNILNQYELENQMLKQSTAGLNDDNLGLLKDFKNQQKRLDEAKIDINNATNKLQNTESGIENLLLLLGKKLKERLIDELKYTQNAGKKPNISRILSIIDISVKDGISDILREVKFENFKQIDTIKQSLSAKYDFLQDDFDNGFESFKQGISNKIDNIFSSEKFLIFRMQISKICENKKDIFELESELNEAILSGFKEFEIEKFLQKLNINGVFFDFLNTNLANFESLQNEKMQNLKALMSNLEEENTNINAKFDENLEKIAKLSSLEMELLNAN